MVQETLDEEETTTGLGADCSVAVRGGGDAGGREDGGRGLPEAGGQRCDMDAFVTLACCLFVLNSFGNHL